MCEGLPMATSYVVFDEMCTNGRHLNYLLQNILIEKLKVFPFKIENILLKIISNSKTSQTE
jgi:hypothetical protein